MRYLVKWNPKPLKFLEKLPKEMSVRIVNKLEIVKNDPFHYVEHYEGADVYKLRIGDYRLLIDIDFTSKILKIRILDHRRRVYER